MNQLTTKDFFAKDNVKKKFEELLGTRAPQFITSILQITSQNKLLQNASPESVYNSAMMAATLNLPINQNLGFAWIVPYKGQAQFQIGWKGFVQLALRTGQYKQINVTEIYQNQFKKYNALTEELDADFSLNPEGKIVGYVAYFKLINGFEKTVYWNESKVIAHASKYSQAYKSANGITPWKDADQFQEMAKKTVLKNTLNKWGILSVEMERATITDQAVIKDAETLDVNYIDNTEEEKDKATDRIFLMINDCKSKEQLINFREQLIFEKVVLSPEMEELISKRLGELK